jgi:hypothetical protein
MWDVILLQLPQPTLVIMFQLSERIEMNMGEERVVTFGFNKENPKNSLAPSSRQSQNQPTTTKVAPFKAKGAKPNLGSSSTSYSTK